MAIPTGLQKAVQRLREIGGAARNDFFNGTVYWTDEQLLDVLKEHFMGYETYTLYAVNDDNLVFQYNALPHHFLDTDNVKVDGTSETPTYDVTLRTVTFATAVEDTVTINAPVYNLYQAAADLWGRKAAQRYDAIRVKAGANQLFLEQGYDHCLEMQRHYSERIITRTRRKKDWRHM